MLMTENDEEKEDDRHSEEEAVSRPLKFYPKRLNKMPIYQRKRRHT